MTITHGYCTLDEIKERVGVVDTNDDDALELAVEAASREIDGWCNRRFFLDTVATARTYLTPYLYAPACVELRGKMWHDFDPATVPVVQSDDSGDGTFSSTWTAGTDYLLEPLTYAEMEAEPQNTIRLLGSRFLLVSQFGRPQLQVTAKWGWPAVPTAVKHACEIVAVDLFKSKDAPFGVAGTNDFGFLRVKDNPMARTLLNPYRLPSGIA